MNMHQGSLKSAVRRSLTKSLLLPPEDGNDTTQCRTIGRSADFISGSSHRGQDQTPLKGKEEEKAMAYRNSNDFQLLQVSREAQNLAQMIDSWSKATNIEGRSQFYAEDLLRGALDLQESLDMLRKLQVASKNMSRIKNIKKQEFIGEKDEDISTQGLGSKRFAVSNSQNRLHKPVLSSDEYSRNCIEELKQVIKESLYNQSMLPSSSDDEKSSSSRSMRYSTSTLYDDKYLEQNTVPAKSICAIDKPKKTRSSNLIAKLMGLEAAPSKIVQRIGKEEKKNCVNSPRPTFDIERPKARKTQFFVQNNDPKQNGLDEITETMHFKGHLKRSQVDGKVLEPPFFGSTKMKLHGKNLQKVDQLPPIVIMKPVHLLYQESNIQKELAIDYALMQDRNQAVKLVQKNNSSDRKHMLSRTLEQKEAKHIEKDIAKPLPDYETSSSLYHKQQRKKAIMTHKKNTEEQKLSRTNAKIQEEKRVKATRIPISHPKTSAVQAKPNKEPPAARTNASTNVSVPQNQDLKPPLRSIPKVTTDPVKDKNKSGVKPIRKSAIVESVIDGEKCKENGIIQYCDKMNDGPKTTGTFHGNDLFEWAEQDAKSCKPDNMSKDHKIAFEAIPRNNQEGRNYNLIEIIQLPDCKNVDGAVIGIEDDLKDIFLSSQSFLGCAKKFFGVEPIHHRRESADNVRICNSKLSLDISEELMAQKYHQQKHTIHPLLQTQSRGRITYFSMDKLVEEISNGIRKLISYSKLDNVAAYEDSLCIMLERELMCKDIAINPAWDIGWDYWICVEEADQVVEEVGKQILSLLIEEAALELI